MHNQTIKHYYGEIKFLAAEIERLGLPIKFIEAAKKQDKHKMEVIFEEFTKNNPELWKRLNAFYERCIYKIFYNNGGYVYDPDEIDPVNLCIIFAMSDFEMDETIIFEKWNVFQEAFRKRGYNNIANYLNKSSISTFNDLIQAYRNWTKIPNTTHVDNCLCGYFFTFTLFFYKSVI